MNNESLNDSFQKAGEAYESLSEEEKFYIDYELEDEIKYGRITKETKELKEQFRKDGYFD